MFNNATVKKSLGKKNSMDFSCTFKKFEKKFNLPIEKTSCVHIGLVERIVGLDEPRNNGTNCYKIANKVLRT